MAKPEIQRLGRGGHIYELRLLEARDERWSVVVRIEGRVIAAASGDSRTAALRAIRAQLPGASMDAMSTSERHHCR